MSDVAWVRTLVVARAGGRCEVRSPACLVAPTFDMGALAEYQRSMHHRRPRAMGGSRALDTNTAANLVLACGSGVTGCHGWVESHRTWALDRGWLVRQGVDPATVPVVLSSGRRVMLDPLGAAYLPPTDGRHYAA